MKMTSRAGFTLLEVLVATVIMGVAVAGLLVGLSQSVRNADRLADYDRAVMLARTRMNDLLLDVNLPFEGSVNGVFPADESGGIPAGWDASLKLSVRYSAQRPARRYRAPADRTRYLVAALCRRPPHNAFGELPSGQNTGGNEINDCIRQTADPASR